MQEISNAKGMVFTTRCKFDSSLSSSSSKAAKPLGFISDLVQFATCLKLSDKLQQTCYH